jgi:hypothetical protein
VTADSLSSRQIWSLMTPLTMEEKVAELDRIIQRFKAAGENHVGHWGTTAGVVNLAVTGEISIRYTIIGRVADGLKIVVNTADNVVLLPDDADPVAVLGPFLQRAYLAVRAGRMEDSRK